MLRVLLVSAMLMNAGMGGMAYAHTSVDAEIDQAISAQNTITSDLRRCRLHA